MTMSSSPHPETSAREAADNRHIYSKGDVVHHYADAEAKLKTAEAGIFELIGAELRDRKLLDIGVGAGRTTPHLLALSHSYVGVDYSPEMVAVCAAKYPGVRFLEADARRLDLLGLCGFDFVFFSFNGIDSIDGEGRAQVLRQVFEILNPGGLFLFSSHNLRVEPEKPWDLGLYRWSRRPSVLWECLAEMLANWRNYRRQAANRWRGDGFAMVTDSGHGFRLLHYYVDPVEQVRQLQELGFLAVEAFDGRGVARSLDAPELNATPHVHYVARRPVAAAG